MFILAVGVQGLMVQLLLALEESVLAAAPAVVELLAQTVLLLAVLDELIVELILVSMDPLEVMPAATLAVVLILQVAVAVLEVLVYLELLVPVQLRPMEKGILLALAVQAIPG
ncbi:MAG: hypothetical protein EBX95_10900 [Acidimicrobiia bacterium]|nr:hypothetical protein [Acidimicrobiia bacterium]